MRVTASNNGMTIRAIAGTYNVLLGIDLDEKHRQGCLGFSIQRSVKKTGETKFLPNSITFPDAPENDQPITTETAPLQKFRWGDYTASPGETYQFKVTARYGKPGALTDGPSATVEVTTEDPKNHDTAIFFNRAVAASQAYNREFGQLDPDKLPEPKRTEALAWLSRGLEEAILDFLGQATDATWALHAAVYEFQKPNLLAGLKAAIDRGAEVHVVYHFRHKTGAKDDTWTKNQAAAKAAGIEDHCTHRTQDGNVIMHNKFVVLLKKNGANWDPQAVWTGSTNWTDGGIYGQLNVGHAVYDPKVAAIYEQYHQLLAQDLPDKQMKDGVTKISPVPKDIPSAGTLPVLSPQKDVAMLDLYGKIAQQARTLLVSAPFQLAAQITKTFDPVPAGTLHYLLLDKEGSLGKGSQVSVIEHTLGNSIGFAATLDDTLTSFQDRLLKDAAPEHYHHPGIHIHSKIIVADPFGDDPILVTGSANFSNNSTVHNDSNSLLVRANKGVIDIYATEFMRMFEHYHFRAAVKQAAGKGKQKAQVITLKPDDSWTNPFYVAGSNEALDRMLFAGTTPAGGAAPVAVAPTVAPPVSPAAPPVTTRKPPKRAAPKKAAVKKAAPAKKKAAAKKTTAKKATAKKVTAKKVTAKKVTATTAKKTAAKKTTAKKATSKKAAGRKKVPAKKKVPARKATSKKPAARKIVKKPAAKTGTKRKPASKKKTAKKASARRR
jgi:phosphatidylserine/phosphatidylglycerophosphate/cardiolipin synthase-like enzyme